MSTPIAPLVPPEATPVIRRREKPAARYWLTVFCPVCCSTFHNEAADRHRNYMPQAAEERQRRRML